MYAYSSAGRAVLVGLAALSIASCGNDGSSASAAGSGEARPEQVDPEALRDAADDGQVRRFYQAVGWQAVWSQPRERQLIEAIGRAEAHGLSRNFFLKDELPFDPSQREARLTKAALDYASALAKGYTDPAEIHEVYTVPRPNPDVTAGLARAIASDQLGPWFASLAPQTEEYRRLSEAFIHYARQAQSGEAADIEDGDPIKPGNSDPRVPRVAEALATNGYLDPRQLQQTDLGSYTPVVAQAVSRMQDDYGIKPDGVVGPDTLRVLNAGARDRARQLAVNLERLRWLERNPPATRIDVNTAATFLDYWRDGQHRDHRVVVVGEPGWETPSLGSPMFRLVANPTWTVPKSIEEDELAEKGPAYFREQNIVRKGEWLVQMPGPKNALGQVKFDMQNEESIYLHDTPHKPLFAQNERHRSHGCVRVHNALQFAALLASDDGILPEFQKAMAKRDDETFVKLNTRIPVRLLYHTAFLQDGRVQFRTDPYGWDEDVAHALGHEGRPRPKLRPHERGRDIGP